MSMVSSSITSAEQRTEERILVSAQYPACPALGPATVQFHIDFNQMDASCARLYGLHSCAIVTMDSARTLSTILGAVCGETKRSESPNSESRERPLESVI